MKLPATPLLLLSEMATMNTFDFLGDDAEDPSQLISTEQEKVVLGRSPEFFSSRQMWLEGCRSINCNLRTSIDKWGQILSLFQLANRELILSSQSKARWITCLPSHRLRLRPESF